MDLSTAYDCIPHDLLIAKLEAYGLDIYSSLHLLRDYLSNRKQRKKIGASIISDWLDLICGIPQGFADDNFLMG